MKRLEETAENCAEVNNKTKRRLNKCIEGSYLEPKNGAKKYSSFYGTENFSAHRVN